MSINQTRNRILAMLPEADRHRIAASLEPIQLTHKLVLYDVNKPIEHVYFIEEGVGSIISFMADGAALETATVGNEGMVGLPVFFGVAEQNQQAFVQVTGIGLRMPVAEFRTELARTPEMTRAVGLFAHATMSLVSQSSACNRRHNIEQRCARWLLLTGDRVGRNEFDLTQEFLSQMLGVRRASVNEVAAALQKAGLIEYTRGRIKLLDRDGLERVACECYRIIRNEFARALGVVAAMPDPLEALQTSQDGLTTAQEGA